MVPQDDIVHDTMTVSRASSPIVSREGGHLGWEAGGATVSGRWWDECPPDSRRGEESRDENPSQAGLVAASTGLMLPMADFELTSVCLAHC